MVPLGANQEAPKQLTVAPAQEVAKKEMSSENKEAISILGLENLGAANPAPKSVDDPMQGTNVQPVDLGIPQDIAGSKTQKDEDTVTEQENVVMANDFDLVDQAKSELDSDEEEKSEPTSDKIRQEEERLLAEAQRESLLELQKFEAEQERQKQERMKELQEREAKKLKEIQEAALKKKADKEAADKLKAEKEAADRQKKADDLALEKALEAQVAEMEAKVKQLAEIKARNSSRDSATASTKKKQI